MTALAWDRREISTWAVSFGAPATWLEGVVHGEGVFVETSTAADLVPILEEIAHTME